MPTRVDLAKLVREAGFRVVAGRPNGVQGEDEARGAWVSLWCHDDGMIQMALQFEGVTVTPRPTADVEKLRKWLRLDVTYRDEEAAA